MRLTRTIRFSMILHVIDVTIDLTSDPTMDPTFDLTIALTIDLTIGLTICFTIDLTSDINLTIDPTFDLTIDLTIALTIHTTIGFMIDLTIDLTIKPRRKVNAFLLPMKLSTPVGDEAIGDIENEASTKEEVNDDDEDAIHPEAASSRDGPRGAAQDQSTTTVGMPTLTGLKKPDAPTEEEILTHVRRGHIPFEAWRQDCMMERWQEDPHRLRNPDASATPVIESDFGFLGLGEDGSGVLLMVVVGKDRRTGYLASFIVEARGNQSYARAAVNEFLDELSYMSMEIQGDGEPTLTALLEGAMADRIKNMGKEAGEAQVRLRNLGKDQHASQGAVESGVKTMAGLTRTGRIGLEKKYNLKLTEDMTLVPWMVRHQVFCHNQFQKRQSGRTPFEELRLVPYTAPMLEFGEAVIGKGQAELKDKLGTTWCKGLWLGRSNKD